MDRALLIFTFFLLAGCSQQSDVEKVIQGSLKDSSSAKFKDFVISKDGFSACIKWNAKNSFGGYGTWTITSFSRQGGTWKIQTLEQDPELCSSEFFTLLDERAILTKKLLSMKSLPASTRELVERASNLQYENPRLVAEEVRLLRAMTQDK